MGMPPIMSGIGPPKNGACIATGAKRRGTDSSWGVSPVGTKAAARALRARLLASWSKSAVAPAPHSSFSEGQRVISTLRSPPLPPLAQLLPPELPPLSLPRCRRVRRALAASPPRGESTPPYAIESGDWAPICKLCIVRKRGWCSPLARPTSTPHTAASRCGTSRRGCRSVCADRGAPEMGPGSNCTPEAGRSCELPVRREGGGRRRACSDWAPDAGAAASAARSRWS
eukprot:scaffold5173_cov125-Isochrysis_galbana.AAC.1